MGYLQSTTRTLRFTLLAVSVVMIGLLAACGGDDDNTSSSGAPAAGMDVAVGKKTSAGTVLVDSSGMTLYTPDAEASGMIVCTGACAQTWPPLSVSGSKPAGPSDLSSRLGTVTRPDGTTQVTLDGHPLYRFASDTAPGDAKGNGISDSAGGTQLVWHAVTTGAAPAPQSPATTKAPSSGGYGY